MRKLLLPIILLLFSLGLHAQTTAVTGNLRTVLGEDLGSNTFIRIRLRNFKPNRPLVSGVGIIGQTRKDVFPDSVGLISTNVYDNNLITPNGTFYTLEFYFQGRFVHAASYLITGATFDFNTATPLSTAPTATIPNFQTSVFVHIQATPATTWTITHNFGVREADLEFFDANFIRIFPDLVTLTDTNTVTAQFVVAQSGRAIVMRAEDVNLTSSVNDPVLKGPTSAQSITGGFDLSLDGNFFAKDVEARQLYNSVSVVFFGAKGDGIADDTVAIQTAIDFAKTMGNDGFTTPPRLAGIVFFPPGTYLISSPLILPRGGATPIQIVQLKGAHIRSSRIVASNSFPTNRAMIEWEVLAARAWHQRIEDLTFWLPDVTGVMAINYKPTLKSTNAEILAETLQIDLRNLLVEGDNEFHSTLIYLEGNVKLSTIENIYCDPKIGTFAFDTLCLKTDTSLLGGDSSVDGNGLNFSHVRGLYAGVRRGGRARVFDGRLNHSTFFQTVCGVGTRSASCYNFVNSYNSHIDTMFNEGRGEQPQIRVEGGRFLRFTNFDLGTPVDDGAGVGNGLELIDTDDSTFETRSTTSSKPSFTSVDASIRVLTVDVNSERNFIRMSVSASASPLAEITNSAPDANLNYIELHSPNSSTWASSGRLRRGQIQTDFIFEPLNVQDSSGNNIFVSKVGNGFSSQPDLLIRNFLDQTLHVALDAGATADQGRVLGFRSQGASVNDWEISVSSAQNFGITNVTTAVPRLSYTTGGSTVFRTGSLTSNYNFGDSAGTNRFRVRGALDQIEFGAAFDTNLYRSAADTLKTDDAFVYRDAPTLAASTTPSVVGGNVFLTNSTASITDFTGEQNGQVIILLCGADTTTSLVDSTPLFLAGAFTCTADDTISLVSNGTVWYETSRSLN